MKDRKIYIAHKNERIISFINIYSIFFLIITVFLNSSTKLLESYNFIETSLIVVLVIPCVLSIVQLINYGNTKLPKIVSALAALLGGGASYIIFLL